METIGDRIKFVRGDHTMEEFAKIIGTTKQQISKYEKGDQNPNSDILSKFAKSGYNVNWLLTGKGKPCMVEYVEKNSLMLVEKKTDENVNEYSLVAEPDMKYVSKRTKKPK